MFAKSYQGRKGNVKEYSRDMTVLHDKHVIITKSTPPCERNTTYIPTFLLSLLGLCTERSFKHTIQPKRGKCTILEYPRSNLPAYS